MLHNLLLVLKSGFILLILRVSALIFVLVCVSSAGVISCVLVAWSFVAGLKRSSNFNRVFLD